MNATGRAFQSAYWTLLVRSLDDAGEVALHKAYELGRSAVDGGLGLVDMAAIHHDVLLTAVRGARSRREAECLVEAAGDLFLEALSAQEMVIRGFSEAREATVLERRRAAIIRRLSSFLADSSVASNAGDALAEIVQLVAEQAREAVDADRCSVVALPQGGPPISAASAEPDAAEVAPAGESKSTRQLTTLDGRPVGRITIMRNGGDFTTAEKALLQHIAEMTSAAVERVSLYR